MTIKTTNVLIDLPNHPGPDHIVVRFSEGVLGPGGIEYPAIEIFVEKPAPSALDEPETRILSSDEWRARRDTIIAAIDGYYNDR